VIIHLTLSSAQNSISDSRRAKAAYGRYEMNVCAVPLKKDDSKQRCHIQRAQIYTYL